MSLSVPRGFRVAGVHCGIKTNPANNDVTLIVGDRPLVAAGVYTQNRVYAAPVAVDRARTPASDIRVVIANSGNANACTGDRGLADAHQMARIAAEACGARGDQALVLSTGIIGEFLPMDKITAGVHAAADRLGNDESALRDAARGILTTDRYEKIAARTVQLDGRTVRIAGIAKGAGMIGPKMATMLGIVMTDAPLLPERAQEILQAAVDVSFNCISVEGHMSTNDTVLLLASGMAGDGPLSGHDVAEFQTALSDMCVELARTIPADGEGASHLITIQVRGCATRSAARKIAETVANSALVKTAVAGNDPNWGRIVSAAGYADVAFDPRHLKLHVNGTLLYRDGEPVPFDAAAVSDSMRANPETTIELDIASGDEAIRFWTSDLTIDYVKLNADYHT